jgi:hypothetical protein
MRRNILSAFFRRAVVAALPLAACNTPSDNPAPYKVPNTLVDDGGTRTFKVGDVIS